MNTNTDEVIFKMMIEDLEKRIKLLQKKNDEMKKLINVLFDIAKKQKETIDGNL